MKKRFRLGSEVSNVLGLVLSVIGFVLTVLCLVGCLRNSAQGLYFLKVTDATPPASGQSVSVYYGWQGYCIEEVTLNCQQDRSIMIVPFGIINVKLHVIIVFSLFFFFF